MASQMRFCCVLLLLQLAINGLQRCLICRPTPPWVNLDEGQSIGRGVQTQIRRRNTKLSGIRKLHYGFILDDFIVTALIQRLQGSTASTAIQDPAQTQRLTGPRHPYLVRALEARQPQR
jgi:hypothetical protein